MNFGDSLKKIRTNQGLSQEQLAEKIGVSRQAITKWETNRGLPDVETSEIGEDFRDICTRMWERCDIEMGRVFMWNLINLGKRVCSDDFCD